MATFRALVLKMESVNLEIRFCSSALQELLQQTPIQGTDDHLIEFSEAPRSTFQAFLVMQGESYDTHKHDIVSFEKGKITIAGCTSKQISLKRGSQTHRLCLF